MPHYQFGFLSEHCHHVYKHIDQHLDFLLLNYHLHYQFVHKHQQLQLFDNIIQGLDHYQDIIFYHQQSWWHQRCLYYLNLYDRQRLNHRLHQSLQQKLLHQRYLHCLILSVLLSLYLDWLSQTVLYYQNIIQRFHL